MPPSGSPPFKSMWQNRRWPTSGKLATKPLLALGSPPLQSRGAESKVAQQWARWLHNVCGLGGSHRFRAAGGIRGGPHVSMVAV